MTDERNPIPLTPFERVIKWSPVAHKLGVNEMPLKIYISGGRPLPGSLFASVSLTFLADFVADVG